MRIDLISNAILQLFIIGAFYGGIALIDKLGETMAVRKKSSYEKATFTEKLWLVFVQYSITTIVVHVF